MGKKRSGHYCRICGARRPNEAFSGKGHRTHVCQECSRLGKAALDAIQNKEEIFDFLAQSHISRKNVARLRQLIDSPAPEVAELAEIVLRVAEVKPHKTRRLKYLAREHRDLLHRLHETGLVMAHGG